MSESTLEAPSLSPRTTPSGNEGGAPPEPWTLRLFARKHPGWVGAIVLAAVSLVLVLWARTRPSFDAYGWLVWGHQALAGSLNTNAAPSWKPLPFVFTVPFALFGHYELWLWMVTSVAISLSGAVFAGRIAYRLTVADRRARAPRGRWGGLVAALFAAVALLCIQGESGQGWWHYVLSAQSDAMVAAFCLGAVDSHLSGHPRWAFVLGAFAALGRPEVWPLLGIYSIWAWRAVPSMRWLVGAGIVAIALLWFGIPALTARTPFVAASNAFGSGRRARSDQVPVTLRRFLGLSQSWIELIALVSLGWAIIRRDWTVVMLGVAASVWVLVEVAFALHGWPGLGRYMYGAAELMVVIAALLVGRLLVAVQSPPLPPGRRWLGGLLVAALVGSLVPAVVSSTRAESRDMRQQRRRTTEISRLAAAVARIGGPARLRACGEPLTRLEYQTVVAWTLQVNVAVVGFKYRQAIDRGNPIVLYTPIPTGGWQVQAIHQRSPACQSLAG